MALEDQVSALVQATSNLTGTVSGKVGEIDQTVSKAVSDLQAFIAGARSEFLIPDLPLPISDNWNADDHLTNNLSMSALPSQVVFAPYDSVNSRYPGEDGYVEQDSWAPKPSLYPFGALQLANFHFVTAAQMYVSAFLRFSGSPNYGQYPRSIIKMECVKLANDPSWEMGIVGPDNSYATRQSRAFIGMGGVGMAMSVFSRPDGDHLINGWNGGYPILCIRPIILTTSTSGFLLNGSGEPYLNLLECKRFIKGI